MSPVHEPPQPQPIDRKAPIARGVTIRMGGQTSIAEYPMDGRTAKRVAIPGTMSLAQQIGTTLRQAREQHADPIAALLELLPSTPYRHGRLLFRGKITDVRRRTERGFGRFERSLRVPRGLDADSIEASLRDGVLTLHLPKPPSLQPAKIEVRAEGGEPRDIEASTSASNGN